MEVKLLFDDKYLMINPKSADASGELIRGKTFHGSLQQPSNKGPVRSNAVEGAPRDSTDVQRCYTPFPQK
jgi:hypothetical protein